MPNPYVGAGAHNAMPWALRMAGIIDWLAQRLGEAPGHCERAYLFYRRLEG